MRMRTTHWGLVGGLVIIIYAHIVVEIVGATFVGEREPAVRIAFVGRRFHDKDAVAVGSSGK